MAIRGGKKLPDKRGFVDGPGGYKGKDDRDRGFGGSSSGSGSSSGGSSSGGSGSGNFNNTPALKTNYTMADVKKNKIAKQLQKAESAASQHKGITGTAYLDQYNTLKAKKDKTKNQLSNLAAMNEQMGYNPTQGMGIMGSLNYNTIGAGDDIANLMNNPLVKMAGMATNPALFAGGQFLKNAYGAYSDENDDTGLLSALGNTAQDVTPFDTDGVTNYLSGVGQNLSTDFRNTTNALSGLYNNFINSLNTDEEETAPNANLQINEPYSDYGGDFNAINFDTGSQTATDNTAINELTIGRVNPDYSNMRFRPGVNMSQTSYNPISTSGPNISINAVTGLPETISNTGGALTYGDTVYGQEGYDSIMASGGVPVAVTQDMGSYMDRRQGRNQGGLIPPMSGPMSNGLGNLFKMK